MKNRNLLYYFILGCILISSFPNSFCQQGALQGKIIDDSTKEGIPFASVALMTKGKYFAATTSDFDGNYSLKPLPPGKYDLKATYVGYEAVLIKVIQIKQDSTTFQDIHMKSSDKELKSFEVKKPAIYLYPTKSEEIKIKLDFKGKIVNTYPKYKDGWTLKAEPDGKLLNLDDKRNYNYLFWDGTYKFPKEHYDYKSGFIVKRKDVVDFLQSKLSYLGLNETEINDFIVYWLPLMNKNETNLIHFWINDNIDNSAVLDIKPKPNTEIRVFMEFRKHNTLEMVIEQQLPSTKRKGFTVVEWGGSDVDGIIN
jgi:hypothetical protein